MNPTTERDATVWTADGLRHRRVVGQVSDASVVRTGASDAFLRTATGGRDLFAPPLRPEHEEASSWDRPDAGHAPRPRRGGDHTRRRRAPAGRAVRFVLLLTFLLVGVVTAAGFTGRSLAESISPAPEPASPTGESGADRAKPTPVQVSAATPATTVTGGVATTRVTGGYEVSLRADSGVLSFHLARHGSPLTQVDEAARLVAIRESDFEVAYGEPLPTSQATVRFRDTLGDGRHRLFLRFIDGGMHHVAAFVVDRGEPG